jgi:cytochrome c-type biogenesis protein
MSFIAGHSGWHGTDTTRARLSAMALALFFVLGFGAVFVALGASATALGRLLLSHRQAANLAGGAIVILFGFAMLGMMNRIAWIQRDWRLNPRLAGGHPASAFVLGIAFGFGWTPCIGPILGAILTVTAVESSDKGVALLAAYAFGLGVPFLLSAAFMRETLARMKRLRRIGAPLQALAGTVLVLFGLAMMTGKLTTFSYWLLDTFPALGQIG